MAEKDKPAKAQESPKQASEDIDDQWGSAESDPRAAETPAKKPDEDGADQDAEDESESSEHEEESDDGSDEERNDGSDEDEDDEHSASAEDPGEISEGEEEGDEDLLPDWAPWAVLLGLLAIGILGGLGVFSSAPPKDRTAADVPAETAATDEKTSDKPKAADTAEAKRQKRPSPSAADSETVEASHLLVQYKGSMRARPEITRTKAEAKKRAEEALAKAKKPAADFGAIVAEYSDEPGAAKRKGSLGSFTRKRMVKPFSDAAFELKPGELSGLVETPFGYHVILRTK